MATLASASAGDSVQQRERRFYLHMAIAIAAIVLAGFGGYIVVGISSFRAPWWVHFHAVTYMGWIALYLLQNLLVVRGELATHRRVGMIMAGWAILMVVVGFTLMEWSIAAHRAPPPVFTAPFLLAMDGLGVLVFAALVGAGLALRSRSDWHRRLMLCATITIIAPGLGRVTVLAGHFSWPTIVTTQLLLIAAAMGFDLRSRGGVHPALWLGAATTAVVGLIVGPLSAVPVLAEHAASLAGN